MSLARDASDGLLGQKDVLAVGCRSIEHSTDRLALHSPGRPRVVLYLDRKGFEMGFRYEVEVLSADYPYSPHEAINRRRLSFTVRFEGRVFTGTLVNSSGPGGAYFQDHEQMYLLLEAAIAGHQKIALELTEDRLRKADSNDSNPTHDYLPRPPFGMSQLLSLEAFGYVFRRRNP